MALSGKALLKKYIKKYHKDEINNIKSQKKQCKVSIDYESLNKYLLEKNGKDFWELEIYNALEKIQAYFDANNYATIKLENVPEKDNLHDLDATYNNKWISCKAMIKNITDVRVDLRTASYICKKCNMNHLVNISDPSQITPIPAFCTNEKCDGTSKDMMLDKDTSIYRNYKLIKLEEPLEYRTGGNSREFKAILLDYLASPNLNLKAGDVVDITGIFKVEPRKVKGRADGYEFLLHVHNITPVDDAFEDSRINEDDIAEIIELSTRDDIFELLTNSLAPEVYGYDLIKQGLILQLFEGGRPKGDAFKTNQMDRWTIHVLLIGDPGIGKSQLIQSVYKRAPKVINIAGTNTSQAGLTISTVKDELTGTWTMEAGAVVLADTGVLCIDEYDKLKQSAQKSLNEPMEQSSVSSAKAGMVQTMSARTSILAAANPKFSKFLPEKDIREQLDIVDSNLSRFDLIFVLEDKIDKTKDNDLACALLNKELMVSESEIIDGDLFKKYVTWAKANVFPKLTDGAKKVLIDFYVSTRQSAVGSDEGKPITARDLKALERMTIASAKTRLSEEATVDDASRVINIYIECLNRLGLTPETAGELQRVLSKKEMEIYSDAENMVRVAVGLEGLPLSIESEKRLRFECGLLCSGTRLLGDDVYDQTLEDVKNSL